MFPPQNRTIRFAPSLCDFPTDIVTDLLRSFFRRNEVHEQAITVHHTLADKARCVRLHANAQTNLSQEISMFIVCGRVLNGQILKANKMVKPGSTHGQIWTNVQSVSYSQQVVAKVAQRQHCRIKSHTWASQGSSHSDDHTGLLQDDCPKQMLLTLLLNQTLVLRLPDDKAVAIVDHSSVMTVVTFRLATCIRITTPAFNIHRLLAQCKG